MFTIWPVNKKEMLLCWRKCLPTAYNSITVRFTCDAMSPLGKLRCHVPRLLASVIAPAAVTITVLPTFTAIGVTNPKSANFGCQHCIQENFICLEKLQCFIYGYTDTIIALYSEGSEQNTQRLDIMMHKWRDRWRSASMPAHMQNHWGSSSPTKSVDDQPWSLE